MGLTLVFSAWLNSAAMDLLDFISDPTRKASLAARTGASPAYLWQVATGWTPKGGKPKRASVELAIAIERESKAIGPECVPWRTLLPDVWESMQSLDGEIAANDDTGPAPDCAEEG